MANAKYLAHLPYQTQKRSFIRCFKSQKLCNTVTVPSQIWDGTDRNGINFYSFLFSFLAALSSLILFSSLSLVPSFFPLYRLLSLYSSLRIFNQSRMFTGSDDDSATRSADEGLEDSFLETCELGVVCLQNSSVPSPLLLFLSLIPLNLSHPLKLPQLILPSHRQYHQPPSISLSHAQSHRSHSWSHLL